MAKAIRCVVYIRRRILIIGFRKPEMNAFQFSCTGLRQLQTKLLTVHLYRLASHLEVELTLAVKCPLQNSLHHTACDTALFFQCSLPKRQSSHPILFYAEFFAYLICDSFRVVVCFFVCLGFYHNT